jgi:hypothetical protein
MGRGVTAYSMGKCVWGGLCAGPRSRSRTSCESRPRSMTWAIRQTIEADPDRKAWTGLGALCGLTEALSARETTTGRITKSREYGRGQ